MIRKCLAIMMSLVLISSVLFTVPTKAETTVQLWVNGVDLLADVDKSITCGEGLVSFDATTKTLTLYNATINKGGSAGTDATLAYGIYVDGFAGDINVKLIGENSISFEDVSGVTNIGLYVGGNSALKIMGGGKLEVIFAKGVFGVYANGNITVENSKLNVIYNSIGSSNYSKTAAVFSAAGNVTIDSSYIDVQGSSNGICADKVVNIQNESSMIINNSIFESIVSINDSIYISNSKLKTTDRVLSKNKIEIKDNSEIDISEIIYAMTADDIHFSKSTISIGSIKADNSVTISNCLDVKITSTSDFGGESGIYCEERVFLSNSIIDISGFTNGIESLYSVDINCCKISCSASRYAILATRVNTRNASSVKPTTSAAGMLTLDNCEVTEDNELYKTGWIYNERKAQWENKTYFVKVKTNNANAVGANNEPTKFVRINPPKADYSAVNAALAKIEGLAEEDYVDFTGVYNVMNTIAYDKTVLEQAAVDKMADDLKAAIKALVLKSVKVKKLKFIKKKIKVKVSKITTLKVKLTPAKVDKAEKKVKWSIDKKGKKVVKFVKKANKLTGKLSAKVKALKKGKAKITCKAPNGKKAVCTIAVK